MMDDKDVSFNVMSVTYCLFRETNGPRGILNRDSSGDKRLNSLR